MKRGSPRGQSPRPDLPSRREMERAFRGRDRSYDGVFYVAVHTTGIFCRPSCGARKPLTRNVAFFGTAREALFAGYRPCKRCRPLASPGRPTWVSRLLAEVDDNPQRRFRDRDLRALGIEPARARRYFQKEFGMTFQAYSRGRRLSGALEQLRLGFDLDDVVLDHGYESYSGFREAFARLFGEPPGAARSSECVVASWIETPLGPMVAAATAAGVCLLEFTDRRQLEAQLAVLRKRFARPVVPGHSPHLERLREELSRYFEGELRGFTVPLEAPGTPFEERVWNELRRIPYGETRSYEDLARTLGAPGAQRAVGRANGMNRVAIVIPCHRVVNKDGRLGGYGGGLWRKELLLRLERTGQPLPERSAGTTALARAASSPRAS